MTDLVSVIIPSYNRYDLLLNAINSVKTQTYKNIEIIVIDDGSTDKRYNLKIDNVMIINLGNKNSRKKLGYPSGGYVRNIGFKHAKGKYIATLDDDDYWLPTKVEKQVKLLKEEKYLCCCSEALISHQIITSKVNINKLEKYNSEYWWEKLKEKMGFTDKIGFPKIINKKLIEKHNLVICSSVMFNRKIFELAGYMPEVENWKGTKGVMQDWGYWKKIINFTEIKYINEPLLIYYKTSNKDYAKK